MQLYIVVSRTKDWPLHIDGATVISAKEYLANPLYSRERRVRIFNLCRTYRYQSMGYYVSLLAEARGHKVIPNVTTIEDMRSQVLSRTISSDLDDLIQKDFARIRSKEFILSIYFGENMVKRYDRLAMQLFSLFQAPLLRAKFTKDSKGKKWVLQAIDPIPSSEIPKSHWSFVIKAAERFFTHRRISTPKRGMMKYDLAVLVNPNEVDPPSDEGFLKKLDKIAAQEGMNIDFIEKDDLGHLAEYDALFIRETTNVNHYTYRFARKAEAEGLIAIDDAASILKCTNKVYLEEKLGAHDIPTPRTMIVHRDNIDEVLNTLGLPCILKRPDSAFSAGVEKVEAADNLRERIEELLEKSELIIAQEFVPTEFDWRVGVLGREPLYVCKYHMAPKHWQIMNWSKKDRSRYGKVETLPLWAVPEVVVQTALSAANLMGDGLYGVDLKQVGNQCVVIEVNDNPDLNAGQEDKVEQEKLYRRLIHHFIKKISERRAGRE